MSSVFSEAEGGIQLIWTAVRSTRLSYAPCERARQGGLPAGVNVILQPASCCPRGECAATELQAVSTVLPNNFVSLLGWPVPIMVRVVDNCNNAITGATVVATFAGADYAPLVLKSLRDDLYTGTWVPLSNKPVRVTIKVLSPPLKEATIELLNQPADFTANLPLINPDGVVNWASFAPKAPVAPGSIISLFGRNLVKQPEQAAAIPLPRSLAGLAVRIGDVNAPLFYAINGQVNAQVPMELASNTAASAVITLDGKVSPPEPLLLSAVQPGGAATTTAARRGPRCWMTSTSWWANPTRLWRAA